MLTKTAFLLGFTDGSKAKRHISRAQAERKHAGLTLEVIDAYMNGHDDGVKGDRFRYFLALRDDTPAAALSVEWGD